MRIAVLHPTFAVFGGTEKLIQDLYPALVRRGHEVTMFTTHADTAAVNRLPGVAVVDIGPIHSYNDPRALAEQTRVGERLAPKLAGFDVVRMHGMPTPTWWLTACEAQPELHQTISNWCCHGIMGGPYDAYAAPHVLAARAAADHTRVPLTERAMGRVRQLQERGTVETARAVMRRLSGQTAAFVGALMTTQATAARNVTRVVTDSRFVADYLHELWGVEPTVCHPGLAITDTRPIVPPGDELLTICRLQDSKNVEGVLRAIALLRGAGPLPFTRYIVGGDGADRARLDHISRELRLEDVVRFEGEIPNELLNGYLDRAGVFILPALDESFGVTYLEAGARGRAVIGPDHGGPSEIVVDGETGWVVNPLDIQAIASAITTAFADRDELHRRGLAARQRVETQFSMERFVQCTERACRSMPAV